MSELEGAGMSCGHQAPGPWIPDALAACVAGFIPSGREGLCVGQSCYIVLVSKVSSLFFLPHPPITIAYFVNQTTHASACHLMLARM